MKISGIQKLSLLDYPDKTACTVFTWGCNFRCPFCHNASLVTDKEYDVEEDKEEFFKFLEKRKHVLDGVAITGGEPLMQDNMGDFIKRVKDMGFSVKLDTNGSYPDKLKDLVSQHLVDYVAMDIKNSREKYATTIGFSSYDLAKVDESIAYLLSGATKYEFRTTVVKDYHTEEDFVSIGQWIKGAEKYFLQKFVDSGNLIQGGLEGFEEADMLRFRDAVKGAVRSVEIRGL